MQRKEVQHCNKISFLALHRNTWVILQDDKLHFLRNHLRLTKLQVWSDLENEMSIWCSKLSQQRALHQSHKLVLDFLSQTGNMQEVKEFILPFIKVGKKKKTNPANCYCADNPLARQCRAVLSIREQIHKHICPKLTQRMVLQHYLSCTCQKVNVFA